MNEQESLQSVENADLSANDEFLQPNLLDIEQEFLDHLTSTEDLVFIIREGFDADLLNTPINKAIYAFAHRYWHDNSEAPSPLVMREEFPKIELYTPVAGIGWTLDKLRERYQRNKVQNIITTAARMTEEPEKTVAYLRNESIEISRKTTSDRYTFSMDDSEYFIQRIQDKIAQGMYKGASVGFKEVDEFTGGLKPGYLAGIAARPKRQKTFYVCQAAIAQAYQGHSVYLATLENTQEEIWQRIGCMISGFPWDKMQRGDVMPADWKMINNAIDNFRQTAQGKIHIARPPIGERTVDSLMLQADRLEATSVVLSQFKYIEPTNDYYRADHEKWGSIVLDLKLAANRQGSERPIYVETQLNREATSMKEMQDADLSQLGLTDMWGQACDIMFCLFQNNDLRASKCTEFGIIEARNSDKSSWVVLSEFRDTTELRIV